MLVTNGFSRIGVSRRVGKGFPTHGVSRRVGKGVLTHGGSSHTRGIKKGGKGISHPRGDGTPTGGVPTHGVSRRVGKGFPTHGGMAHPRGEFPHMGYQEGWEREFTHTQGIKKGGKGISHPRGDGTHGGRGINRPLSNPNYPTYFLSFILRCLWGRGRGRFIRVGL